MEDIRLFPVNIGTRAHAFDLPEETDEKYYIRITGKQCGIGQTQLHNGSGDHFKKL